MFIWQKNKPKGAHAGKTQWSQRRKNKQKPCFHINKQTKPEFNLAGVQLYPLSVDKIYFVFTCGPLPPPYGHKVDVHFLIFTIIPKDLFKKSEELAADGIVLT